MVRYDGGVRRQGRMVGYDGGGRWWGSMVGYDGGEILLDVSPIFKEHTMCHFLLHIQSRQ